MSTLKKFGLGKGLANLLGDVTPTHSIANQNYEKTHLILLNHIEPSQLQPRKNFKQDSVEELALSIKQQGVLQPIILRKLENQKYEIIAGERRWRAAKLAGLKNIPSLIRDMDNKTAIAISIIENIQREDLDIIEEAHAYKRLRDEFAMTQEEIAERVGKARTTITNIMRLLNLTEEVITMLSNKQLELGHAKLLLSLPEAEQIKIANIIIEKNLTVREAEALISVSKPQKNNKVELSSEIESRIQFLQKRISHQIHSKVNININKEGKGRVTFNVESIDEIEWLAKKLEQSNI